MPHNLSGAPQGLHSGPVRAADAMQEPVAAEPADQKRGG